LVEKPTGTPVTDGRVEDAGGSSSTQGSNERAFPEGTWIEYPDGSTTVAGPGGITVDRKNLPPNTKITLPNSGGTTEVILPNGTSTFIPSNS
jgi:hypothetical protein